MLGVDVPAQTVTSAFLGDRLCGTLGAGNKASDAELTLKAFPSDTRVRPPPAALPTSASPACARVRFRDCSVRGTRPGLGETSALSFTQSLCWCHGTRSKQPHAPTKKRAPVPCP